MATGVLSALAQHARRAPSSPALVSGASRWTAAELVEAVAACASRLAARGAGPGTPVAVALPPSPAAVIVTLAAAATGGGAVGAKTLAAAAADAATLSGGGAPPLAVVGREDAADGLRAVLMNELLLGGVPPAAAAAAPPLEDPPSFAWWGGKEHTSQAVALLAGAASDALALQDGDAVLCAVPTLHHAMFGFSVGAALRAGVAAVLPEAPGAASALAALPFATHVVCDAHVLKALNAEAGVGDAVAALKGGLVKVGGGDAVGKADPLELAGVSLLTIGVPK